MKWGAADPPAADGFRAGSSAAERSSAAVTAPARRIRASTMARRAAARFGLASGLSRLGAPATPARSAACPAESARAEAPK